MLNFFQPAAMLFIGLALSIYGLIHSVRHAPQATAFQAAMQALPDAIAVVVFAFGIVAIVAGILLLFSGIKGVRNRARDIHRAYGHPHHGPRPRNGGRGPRDQYSYEDDWDEQPAYR